MTTSRSRKKLDNGHWDFTEQLDFENAYGFIYLIKEKSTNCMYIGKKAFRSAAKKTKGSQSNWRSYTSSSKIINELIKEKGEDAFDFIVLEQYYSKGGFSWAETWSQVVVEVPSNNHIWYNRFIDKVTWKVTEPVTNRHKKRLQGVINGISK